MICKIFDSNALAYGFHGAKIVFSGDAEKALKTNL